MDLTNTPKNLESWQEAMVEMRRTSAAGQFDTELVAIDDDHLVFRVPITDQTRQPFGLFHGGVSLFLTESAASLHACWLADLTEVYPVGLEVNGTHLSSAREGAVHVTARVIKSGRRLIVHDVEVTHEESGKVLCKARISNLLIERRD